MSRSHDTVVAGLVLAAALSVSGPAEAALFGPSPYLSFSDSPFSGGSFTYFHLETFEDGLFDSPGASASGGFVLAPPSAVDSVDADDGVIDGSGSLGHSLFFGSSAPAGISFAFDATTLGHLPTSVGIVWTDGGNDIFFEAFNESGASLGTRSGTHADGSFFGMTGEDRFYGVTSPGGIARIFIGNAATGIEVDHLQYGLEPVPEPATVGLLGLGVLVLISRRRT